MKKISMYAIILLFSFVMIPGPSVKAAGFPDVENYQDEIGYLEAKQIIRGFPDGTFKPAQPVTRLQAIQMLLKAKGITDLTAPNPGMKDVKPGDYGYDAIAKAVQLGIISGKPHADGSKYFDGSNSLTRGQMAKILVEANGFTIDSSNLFFDVDASNTFQGYISTLAAERITNGYGDGTYKPKISVSRQHFSVFVARMLDDSFKEERLEGAARFLLDVSKKYTWTYHTESESITSTMMHVREEDEAFPEWNLWQETSKEGTGYFLVNEDSEGLYEGSPYMDAVQLLYYPLYTGKSWREDGEISRVIAIDRTMTTKAGTFTDVTELKTSSGWTYYYAPNVGLIQSLHDGSVYGELVRLD